MSQARQLYIANASNLHGVITLMLLLLRIMFGFMFIIYSLTYNGTPTVWSTKFLFAQLGIN
jgi:hypothetical protein